jgi:hypothetical protein
MARGRASKPDAEPKRRTFAGAALHREPKTIARLR